tara:strand:- start:1278 stop:1841 length:564 start_codon:yes stop_codon:yes gene_type:complete
MKFSIILLILALLKFSFLSSNETNLDNKFVSVKDFLVLKFDFFFQNNSSNLFKGGGLTGIAYQNLKYKIKIDNKNNIVIELDAVMNEQRYTSKTYYPKIKDCNQVRNKIVENKYGYSFFSQNFNNLVNNETLSNSINEQVLNISSLDSNVKKQVLENTEIKINIIHPKQKHSFSCGGKLIDTELTSK